MSSRFEFLGSTAIGQYIPRQSWIHRCDPRARLLAYLALFVGVVFTRDFVGLVIGLGCVLSSTSWLKFPLSQP
jgi:energy-coupling factor transport system permease protein